MPVNYLKETPSQTAGPYVHIGLLPAQAGLAMRHNEALNVIAAEGERIVIEGIVHDGLGNPVKDALIELWQPNARGELGAKGLWGRAGADHETGLYRFETIRPPALPWRNGQNQAPHCSLLIFARGINIHLHTRMYFPEDAALHASDPALQRVDSAARRTTLVAAKQGPGHYRFDIRLQGENETVFFDM